MRAAINPYSPGSGRKPPALVGRETEIRTMENLVERTAHELTGRPLLLSDCAGSARPSCSTRCGPGPTRPDGSPSASRPGPAVTTPRATRWPAEASPIDLGSVDAAVETGFQRLDDGFFKARWDRATPAERRLLAAMAADGPGPSAIARVAQRLGRKVTSLGQARAALIAKGLVYSPDHGQLAYTVPGMADFVSRNGENVD